jgi:hypothetical protein
LKFGGLNGGTGRNSEKGIGAWISFGLVNLGKIGSSKWRFYEYAIDDFGDKKLRAKWGMNWVWAEDFYSSTNTTFATYAPAEVDDEDPTITSNESADVDEYLEQTAHGYVRFGLVKLEQDSTLSFNNHITECNKPGVMKGEMIKCHKQVNCTVSFTEDWFDSDCLDKYRLQT